MVTNVLSVEPKEFGPPRLGLVTKAFGDVTERATPGGHLQLIQTTKFSRSCSFSKPIRKHKVKKAHFAFQLTKLRNRETDKKLNRPKNRSKHYERSRSRTLPFPHPPVRIRLLGVGRELRRRCRRPAEAGRVRRGARVRPRGVPPQPGAADVVVEDGSPSPSPRRTRRLGDEPSPIESVAVVDPESLGSSASGIVSSHTRTDRLASLSGHRPRTSTGSTIPRGAFLVST